MIVGHFEMHTQLVEQFFKQRRSFFPAGAADYVVQVFRIIPRVKAAMDDMPHFEVMVGTAVETFVAVAFQDVGADTKEARIAKLG